MKLIDISMPIEEGMVVYPGNPGVKVTKVSEASSTKTMLSELSFGSHTGTHVDAPRHVSTKGTPVDRLSLSYFYGKCKVIDMTHVPFGGHISAKDVQGLRLGTASIVLFKTKNSGLRSWRDDYVFLGQEAAHLLVKKGVRTVGVDYLSVQKLHQGYCAAHCALLLKRAVIIEGLRLRAVQAGTYVLSAAPLKVVGGDGSPCRAFLVK